MEPRRLEVRRTGFVAPPDAPHIPLQTDGQSVVLYNLANEGQHPRSARPAIRILGLFDTEQTAWDFIPPNAKEHYYVSPTHKFVPILASPGRDPGALVAEVCALHESIITQSDAEFKRAVDNQGFGETGKSAHAMNLKRTRREAAPIEGAAECMPVRATACVAGQAFAVITHLTDIRESTLAGAQPSEPLVAVLFATDTEAQAEAYCKYTASGAYSNCSLDVVCMYSWLFVEDVTCDQIAREEFADADLDKLFKKRRADKVKIAELEVQHPDCVLEIDPNNPRELPVPDILKFIE
jgi:hypothetical protein